jgi:hypothetical protein
MGARCVTCHLRHACQVWNNLVAICALPVGCYHRAYAVLHGEQLIVVARVEDQRFRITMLERRC